MISVFQQGKQQHNFTVIHSRPHEYNHLSASGANFNDPQRSQSWRTSHTHTRWEGDGEVGQKTHQGRDEMGGQTTKTWSRKQRKRFGVSFFLVLSCLVLVLSGLVWSALLSFSLSLFTHTQSELRCVCICFVCLLLCENRKKK